MTSTPVKSAERWSDAPARIWATVNGASTRLTDGGRQLIGGWSEDSGRPRVSEYIRADIARAREAELVEVLRAIVEATRMVDPLGQPRAAHCCEIARAAIAKHQSEGE